MVLLLSVDSGKIPVLYLDFYVNDSPCDAVISNSFYGSYQLTNYLIQMGHRKIAYVGTILVTKSITDRYLGYYKALMEHGIEVHKEYLLEDRDRNNCLLDVEHYMKIPDDIPTAFVCNCDVAASDVIKKLEKQGYIHKWSVGMSVGCFSIPTLLGVVGILLSYALGHKANQIGEAYIEEHLRDDLQYAIAFVTKYPSEKTTVMNLNSQYADYIKNETKENVEKLEKTKMQQDKKENPARISE